MKKIDEFVDKLEKRVEGILQGITHGQNINQEKVKASVRKEVIALCKIYYGGGFVDGCFECDDEYPSCEEFEISKEQAIQSAFYEED